MFRAKLGKARVILKGGCEEQGAKFFFFFLSFSEILRVFACPEQKSKCSGQTGFILAQ